MIPIAEKKVLNAGLVALISLNGTDITPVEAARTSYRDFADEHTNEQNENLVDYLIRKRHDTPIEFASATFYMVMPIFVARQMVRHRTASINEESLRYVNARDDFYIPSREECKAQSTINKQGSGDLLEEEIAWQVRNIIDCNGNICHGDYNELIKLGLSKELARTVLPLGQYTAWYWTANLRNIFHLLKLRKDVHAQYQIRVYADAMHNLLKPYFPKTFEAWENHVLNAVTFSADEMEVVAELLKSIYDGFFPLNREGDPIDLIAAAENKGLRPSRVKELCQKFKAVKQ